MKSMLMTIKQMLTRNWFLKVISLIIAGIIWLAVINVNDPTKEITIYNVPIHITNEGVITDNNQVYEVKGRQYVNVTISGRRSVIAKIDASSFIAEASLEEMSLTNSVPVNVRFTNPNLEKSVTISNQSVNQINVVVENIIEKEFEIEPQIIGELESEYSVSGTKLKKNKVTVRAKESIVDKIGKAIVIVDVTDATESIKDKYKVEFIDTDEKKYTLPSDAELSVKKVTVTTSILRTVNVPIIVELKGDVPNGFEMGDINVEPSSVQIVGESSKVSQIQQIKLSGDELDMSDVISDFEKKINLYNYIPEGTEIVGKSEAVVSVGVKGHITREFIFDIEDIDFINLQEQYEMTIVPNSVTISVLGFEDDFEDISLNDFRLTVDLKDIKVGKNNVPVEVYVPEPLSIIDAPSIRIDIKKKEETSRIGAEDN